jgi:S-methylmethionine-dependent homocysteine/selenocysteine methylase
VDEPHSRPPRECLDKSHAELNESTELDTGDPIRLGALYAQLRPERLPYLNIMGGCCGTDHRHVECIAASMRRLQYSE